MWQLANCPHCPVFPKICRPEPSYMMKWFFLDTNVLIYLLENRQSEKYRRADEWVRALAAQDALTISPQVVLEFAYVVRRKFRDLRQIQLEDYVESLRPWCTAPASFDTYFKGLALHFETGYQVPDCTMLASALEAGCEVFLSEDLQGGQIVEGMLIVNPFTTDCAAFLANN